MQYRTLGRTGIQVSPYALGTLMFASSWATPPEDSVRIIHKALDAGINFVDTADAYGDSEEVVGKALEGRRDDVVLATKFSRPMGRIPTSRAPRGAGSSPPWRTRCVACRPTTSTSTRSTAPTPHRHRGDALGADRPDPQRQGPRDRRVEDSRLRHRRGPMGRRAARPGAVPHRAAALLDPQPRHRARGAAHRPALRHGHPGLGPLGQGLLTGRVRKGRQRPRRAGLLQAISTTSAGSTRSRSSSPSPPRRACR